MKKMIADFVIAAALLVAPAAAVAAPGQVSLHGDVKLEKVVVEAGQSHTVLSEPTKVLPGDRLLFSTRYTNAGPTAVQNFVVTNPLPSAVVLASGGTTADQVSVDGGKTWGKLAMLTVADGKGGRRPAQPGDVTHLRWVIPSIAPGASGSADYHAIVR